MELVHIGSMDFYETAQNIGLQHVQCRLGGNNMKLGAQLFTVRAQCKTLEGLSESLKKVADIGYTTVQISGSCTYDAHWLKQELDKNGLKCVLTHTAPVRLQEETVAVCREHKIFGAGCVGLGGFVFQNSELPDQYNRFVELYKPVAKTIKEQGLYFMHHNHDYEFLKTGGKTILEKLAEDFSPDELGFTLDTFWVQAGGASPAEWIRQLKGRVPCVHLKDYQSARGGFAENICAIGDGNINFDPIIQAAEAAGTEYLLVEQDDCHGEDPFACLDRSYRNLRAMGLL